MSEGLDVRLDDKDLRRLVSNLRGVSARKATAEIKRAEIKSLSLAQRLLAVYPPPPPNSTYTRTGTLGKGWKFRRGDISVSPNRITGHVFNTVPYSQWVQDERTQARVHRGRWNTIQTMTRGAALHGYRLYFQQALVRIAHALRAK